MLTIEHMEKSLERIHEWIRSADQKISILLAFEGITLALIAPKILTWFKEASHTNNILSALFLLNGGILIAYSFFRVFRALIPDLKNVSSYRSLIFFGDIASMSLADFTKEINAASDNDLISDCIQQTHISALIASAKHENFKASVTYFLRGGVMICIGWFLLHLHLYVG